MSTPKTQSEWKLAELAEAVGVSSRTVRYYVQRGLLPAPPFRGPDTVYGEEHLVRLKAIRVLQARFLPLDAIQVELQRLSLDDLRRLADSAPTATPPEHAPPPSATAPLLASRPPPPGMARYERWEIIPGLELHVSEAADTKTRALAERVRALIAEFQEREKP